MFNNKDNQLQNSYKPVDKKKGKKRTTS